ncbi:MAG: ABC transporter substrate-binding protein [Clostridia bacterium]|nr:ABC transporter substrate-binding protein [Clostridia bacterium]
MKRSKWIKLVAIVAAFCLFACGCGGNTQQEKPADYNATGLPIVDEPVTLRVLTTRWYSLGDSFTSNQWLIDLEKRTNVHIEWIVYSLTDWGEQKGILLSGGDLPDIVLGCSTFTDVDILTNTSYFHDFTDLIDKYMPNLKAAMEEKPEMRKICTYEDGKIYSLPAVLPLRSTVTNQPVINMQWLKNLGLSVPRTLEELEQVFYAFRDGDPNGNGDPNDEYAISGAGGLPPDLLTPFGITDQSGTHMMLDENNEWVFYPIQENYKQALKWLNKMYVEGCIDPEMFTQDLTMLNGKRRNEEAPQIGFDYAWTPDANFGGKWASQYEIIPSIVGPDGKAYATGDPDGVNYLTRNQALITTDCVNPEIAARWLDEFYTGEASIQNTWGDFNTAFTVKDGKYYLNAPPEGQSADSWYWTNSMRNFGPKYTSDDFYEKIILDPQSGDGLKQEAAKLAEPYVTIPYPMVMFTAEEAERISELSTDIERIVANTCASFVSRGNIDKAWDSYVNRLKKAGVEELISIYRTACDRYSQE